MNHLTNSYFIKELLLEISKHQYTQSEKRMIFKLLNKIKLKMNKKLEGSKRSKPYLIFS